MSNRYAIVIGTNYVGTPYSLSGCVNDAEDWATLLSGVGYKVTKLVGSDATGGNIVSAWIDAKARARWGDRIVITYSGHGTWVPDQDGDEVDRRDEAWCPDDFQRSGVLRDDTIAALAGSASAGVGQLVLSDSCFSGTMTRLLNDEASAQVRFLPPALISRTGDLLRDGEAEAALPLTRTYTRRASLISGCAEDEVSYDAWFGGRANGAFTRAAIDAYAPGQTLNAWHTAIRDRLPSEDYPQSPALVPANVYRRYTRAL